MGFFAQQATRSRITAFAVVLSSLAVGCSGGSPSVQPTLGPAPAESAAPAAPATSLSLTGTVKGADGQGIAGATVSVVDAEPNPNAGKQATVDGEGRYTLSGLSFAGFTVVVHADGFGDAVLPVELSASTQATTLHVVLAKASGTSTVTGTVSGPEGTRIAGASVTISEASLPDNNGRRATTDASGAFRLANLSPGQVVVSVAAGGYQLATRAVTVPSGGGSVAIDVTLQPAEGAAVLTGSVRTQAGAAIANATVAVVSPASGPNAGRSTTTNGSGMYRLEGMTAGTLTIRVTATGYQATTRTVSIVGAAADADVILVSESTPTFEIKGRITGANGAGLSGATISVTDASPNPNAGKSTQSDGSGSYSLAGLLAGTVNLSISAVGHNATTRSVTVGASSTTLDVALSPVVTSYTIRGRVTNQSGAGLADLLVAIPTISRTARTDAAGYYEIGGIDFTTQKLTVSVSASEYYAQSVSVQLAAGTEVTTLNIILVARTDITFAGLGPTGTPYSGHSERGFTVATTAGNWVAYSYGSPGPSVVFYSASDSNVTGTLRVTGDGRPFALQSLDLYSSVTRIPYTIIGRRNGSVVFTMSGETGLAQGRFLTVSNPQPEASIDSLTISLSNGLVPAGTNPMGVDNIRVVY